jgi:NADH-quinone oxidoreductase subunit L
MALTFFGTYRGPAWTPHAAPAAVIEAAVHGARHPADAHAHGQAQKEDHEVSHGAADATAPGHAWHGPHEGPSAMTAPLMALAVGAIVVGFFGVPQALGGRNAVEHFLAPSFQASASAASQNGHTPPSSDVGVRSEATHSGAPAASEAPEHESAHLPRVAEIALMLLSVVIAVAGILTARHFYLTRPELSRQATARWPGIHALLFHKYYVDELYNGTIVRGTLMGARDLWTFDRRVVDGAVDGSGALTRIGAWFSHMADKYVVDGFVNLVGWTARGGSHRLRRLQTGLVQNYALLMLLGVFGFLTVYLLAR